MCWKSVVAAVVAALFPLGALAQSAANPNQTCTSFSGTIAGDISGAAFDLTIDDIVADDITCDIATCASFVSTCTGLGCGSSVPKVAGTPTAADNGTLKFVDDDNAGGTAGFAAVCQPAAGGTASRTASACDAMVTGTGNQVTMVPIFTILAAADAGCAAAGTPDADPSCAREACSNMGLLCHDAINMTSMAAPALAAADCATEAGAGLLYLVACY